MTDKQKFLIKEIEEYTMYKFDETKETAYEFIGKYLEESNAFKKAFRQMAKDIKGTRYNWRDDL